MTISGNLPNQQPISDTTQYFNNFYDLPKNISPDVNDVVVSYFQTITGDAETGYNLASAVIYTALQQNIDPVQIIDQLRAISLKNKQKSTGYNPGQTNPKNQDTNVYDPVTETWSVGPVQYAKPGPSASLTNISELDAFLTVFLNFNRVGTSLLGISNSPQTSVYVKRAILP
jgi:hypothetical protein